MRESNQRGLWLRSLRSSIPARALYQLDARTVAVSRCMPRSSYARHTQRPNLARVSAYSGSSNGTNEATCTVRLRALPQSDA